MTKPAKIIFTVATLFAVAAAYDKCYNEGERCIGARGFPAVPYYPCCDQMECSAKDTSYGGYGLVCAKKRYTPPKEEPKCYKEGERCIGASGFPSVPYHPCCDGMECSAKDTTYGGYGLVCAKKGYKPTPPKYEPKCYKDGERCIGAPGFPAVPYHPCCDGDCIAKDTTYGGYGLVCAKKGYASPKHEPKCYKEGERCIGAPGFPAVPYHPCCEGDCVVKDTSYGGYGLVCGKKAYPTIPPPPKCIKTGEQCKKGYGPKCCGYDKCVKGYGKYAYVCGQEPTLPPTTTAPKCIKAGEECKKGYGPKCCGYNKCVKGYGKYAFVCGPEPTLPPTTTAPKCIKAGDECKKGYGPKCCGYNKCVKGYGKYSFVCGPEPTLPPTTTAPKCLKAGEECKKGYGPKCCGYNKCVKGYGKYSFVCGPEPTLPPTTTAPKCIKAGEECKKGYGPKCCGYNKCVKGYGKYSFVCGPEPTLPPTTTTAKCIGEGEKCGSGYDACCADMECKKTKAYGYESRCVKKTY